MKWLGLILFLFLCGSNLLFSFGALELNASNSAVLNEIMFLIIYVSLSINSVVKKHGLVSNVCFFLLAALSIFNLIYIFTDIPEIAYLIGSLELNAYGVLAIIIILTISKTYERYSNR